MIKLLYILSGLSIFSYMNTSEAHETSAYVSARLLGTFEHISAMDTSLRPGVGRYMSGRETASYPAGSFAIGEKIGSHWRIEAEYVLPRRSNYTSGSTSFPTSLNYMRVRKQRVAVNLFRDTPITKSTYIYIMAGLGASIAETTGWQGSPTRQYMRNDSAAVMYGAGAGISRYFGKNYAIDLGYRFVDLGEVQSGLNSFSNIRRLQDEQLKGYLYLNEIMLGFRLAL